MSSPFSVIYEFDRFRLVRSKQRLTRDGMLVVTPGRTLPLLVALLENRENGLSTEKLVNSLFAKSLVPEEELVGEILALKRLLDDTSTQTPMIRTVPGTGYRFETEVTEYLGDSGSDRTFGHNPTEVESQQPVKSSSGRNALFGAVGAVALIAIGVGVWHFMSNSRHDPTSPNSSSTDTISPEAASSEAPRAETTRTDTVNYDPPANGTSQVAVLPFQSLTGASMDDRFNKSLTESLISSLGKNKLHVVPEAAVQHYMESGATDPMTAGRELGAQLIVRGMAQRLAGRIVVKVQLISTEDGSQIWSKGFEGDSSDIAGLTTKISAKIGKGVPSQDQP